MIDIMQGLHLTADLHHCAAPAALLADREALRALALRAVAAAGLSPVGELFHAFGRQGTGAAAAGRAAGSAGGSAGGAAGGAAGTSPGGVTGVVLLAESHVALHTWPELAAVTLDVYVCNHAADNSARAEALLRTLEAAFAPGRCERQRVQRGSLAPRPLARAVQRRTAA